MRFAMIRPLHCVRPGIHRSADGAWEFVRHESDPHPKRWFIYRTGGVEPIWFDGSASLGEAVARVEEDVARGGTPEGTE